MEVAIGSPSILVMGHKRASHLKATLEGLRNARNFNRYRLVVILDGHFPEVREVVENSVDPDLLVETSHPEGWTARHRILENLNLGLKHAFMDERTEYCVVFEDDIVIAPEFLDFVDNVIASRKNDSRFRAVNGFSNFIPQDASDMRAYVRGNFGVGWGWALTRKTYRRIARILDQGGDHHWDSRIEPFIRTGYVINPARSLVRNIGLDGSGSHTSSEEDRILARTIDDSFRKTFREESSDWAKRVVPLRWREDYVLIDAIPIVLRPLAYSIGHMVGVIEAMSNHDWSIIANILQRIRRSLRKRLLPALASLSHKRATKRHLS